MPTQQFLDDDTTAVLATIAWDFGYQNIDLDYGGEQIAELDNLAALRTVGLQGPTPDGATLTCWLRTGREGDYFEIERDGHSLASTGPNFAASRTKSDQNLESVLARIERDQSLRAAPSAADRIEDDKKCRRARRSLRACGVLGVLIALGMFGLAQSVGKGPDAALARSAANQFRILAVIQLAQGLSYVGLSAVAKGTRARVAFGVATILVGFNVVMALLVTSVGGATSVPSLVIPSVLLFEVGSAYRRVRRSDERERAFAMNSVRTRPT